MIRTPAYCSSSSRSLSPLTIRTASARTAHSRMASSAGSRQTPVIDPLVVTQIADDHDFSKASLTADPTQPKRNRSIIDLRFDVRAHYKLFLDTPPELSP